jgi:hypothetical protein
MTKLNRVKYQALQVTYNCLKPISPMLRTLDILPDVRLSLILLRGQILTAQINIVLHG